jgi:hypothetical protein
VSLPGEENAGFDHAEGTGSVCLISPIGAIPASRRKAVPDSPGRCIL